MTQRYLQVAGAHNNTPDGLSWDTSWLFNGNNIITSITWGGTNGVVPGDTINLKGVFRSQGNFLDIKTAQSGTDALPITWDGSAGAEISALVLLDDNWTQDLNHPNYPNVWVNTHSTINTAAVTTLSWAQTQIIKARVFVDREPLLRAMTANDVGTLSTNPKLIATRNDLLQYWYMDSATNKIYLYSEVNPNGKSVEFAILGNAYTIYAMRFRGPTPAGTGYAGNTIIKNLDITGGYYSSVWLQLAVSNVKFYNCRVGYGVGHGICLDTGDNVSKISNIEIKNCYIHRHTGPSEQYWQDSLTEDVIGGDGILLGNSLVSDVTIENNYISDFAHTCVNVHSTRFVNDAKYAAKNINILNNYLGRENSVYNRGIGVGQGTQSLNTPYRLIKDILIKGNLIYNQNVRNQIQGYNVKFINNISHIGGADAIYGIRNDNISCGAYSYAEDVTIANNIVIGGGVGIRLTANASNSNPIFNGATVINNITLNCGIDLECSESNVSSTLLPQIIQNNNFTNNRISWYSASYPAVGTISTVDSLNSDISTLETILFRNNLAVDPELDSNYVPDLHSAVIGKGTAPISKLDFYDRPLVGNRYHIGACWPSTDTSKKRR